MRLPDPALEPGYYSDLLPKRFLAWVVDVAVVFVIVALLVVMSLALAFFILPFLWAAVAVGYRYVMLTRYDATLGMQLAALRLRHLDGTKPQPLTCLLHALIYSGTMVSVLGQVASVALMLTLPYRQGLNDLLLSTTMVHRDIDD